MLEDPNDTPPEETPADDPELDLEEDDEAPEDEDETAEPETPEEEQPEQDADDDLPDDPKTLKRMVREAVLREQHTADNLRQSLRREPPTREAEPDEVADLLAELESEPEKATPKVLAHILRRDREREAAAERGREAAAALAAVPEPHRADVQAMVEKFHLPVPVAHAIFKGALYDRAMERKRARKTEAEPVAPSRPQGKAPLTRPVRRTAEPANGAGYVVVEGLKIKAKQRPGEYAATMDRLTPEQRRIVFRAKQAGKISVE